MILASGGFAWAVVVSPPYSSSPSFNPSPDNGAFDGIKLPATRGEEFQSLGFTRVGASNLLLHRDSGGLVVAAAGVEILSDIAREIPKSLGTVVGIERVPGDAAAKDEYFKYGISSAGELDLGSSSPLQIGLSFLRLRIQVPDPDSKGKFQNDRNVSLVLRSDLGCGVIMSDTISFLGPEQGDGIQSQLLRAGAKPDSKEARVWRLPFFDGAVGPELTIVFGPGGGIERILTPVPIREAGELKSLRDLVADDTVSVRGWPKPHSDSHPGIALSFWRQDALQQMVVGENQKAAFACRSPFDLLDLSISNGQFLPLRSNLSAIFSVITNEWMLGLLHKVERRQMNSLINECAVFGDSLNRELHGREPRLITGAALTRWIVENSDNIIHLCCCLVNGGRHRLIKHLDQNKRITAGDFAALMTGYPDSEQEFPLTHAHIVRFNLARSLLSSWVVWKDSILEFDRSGPFGDILPGSLLVQRVAGGVEPITGEVARLIKGYAMACPPGKRWSGTQLREFISGTPGWRPDYNAIAQVLDMPNGDMTTREFWEMASIQAGWTQSRLLVDCKAASERFLDLLGAAEPLDLIMDNAGGFGPGSKLNESFRRVRGFGGALKIANTTYSGTER